MQNCESKPDPLCHVAYARKPVAGSEGESDLPIARQPVIPGLGLKPCRCGSYTGHTRLGV